MIDHYSHVARVIHMIVIKNVEDISISDEVKARMKSTEEEGMGGKVS